FARAYTLRLLDQTPAGDWFRLPPGGVTHVAWQVGHLAVAQYFLALERVRGARPETPTWSAPTSEPPSAAGRCPTPTPAATPRGSRSEPPSTASTSRCSSSCPGSRRSTSTP